jgi:pyridoxine 4-dehydrogenase
MADISATHAGVLTIGDLKINRLGFGAMRITGEGIWGEPKDHNAATAVLKRAVELGVNFIDTADAYGPEVSEKLIAEALKPYPDDLVIATKGGLTRMGPGQWIPDCSPAHLREACEASLQRLDVEQIQLYQLHTVDPKVPFKESLQTLIELKDEGKIKHIGLSNVEPDHLTTALEMTEIVSVQNNYNVMNREHEDVLKLCEERGIAFIPYFPIGGNVGGVSQAVLDDLADKYEVTVRQIALSWLLAHSPVIVPIPGTSSVAHLEENVAATAIKLSEEDLNRLNAS